MNQGVSTNGNRKTQNTGAYAYLANSNRLTTALGSAIVLDAAGNTLSDSTRSYTYNNAGHLSTVAGAGYSYNAQRQRTRKIVGSQGTVYHYDLSGNLIAETNTTGVTQRSYVWADGVPLAQIDPVTTLPPDIIVDNTQATFTGTWATSTSITGFYGTNYRTNTKGTGKDKAVWTLNVPTTGTYQVHVRHVAASTHASNAPFTVKHSTGSQTIAVNQRSNNGQWVSLGNFPFTTGIASSVTLTDNANGTVIADAVKLVATSGGTTSEAIRYLHTDHQGTPRLATNPQGQKIWSWEGEAFGNTPPNQDPDGNGVNTVINLRFPGQYYDGESGLFYNWNRYYDPKLGRYVTSDPIGLEGGLNTYVYVRNNSLRWIDLTGLFSYNYPPPRTQPISDDLGRKVSCLENCLGIPLVVTGGSEPHPGYPSDPHAGGVAVDFGFGGNPLLPGNKEKFFCCAKDCGFKHGGTHGGNHFHMESEKRSNDRNEIPDQPCCQAKKG